MRLGAVALCLAGPAAAQEFVEVTGPLRDEAFYRAVACAAPPGGDCAKPFLRWPEEKRSPLTVGLVSLPRGLPDWRRRLFDAGLDSALAQINAVGAAIRLRRVAEAPPDIEIHVVATAPGAVMQDTGVPALDGEVLPLGRVALRARDGEIREALIAVSAQARRREIASVLLEEITQGLGLMTDIKGAAYFRSVFFEDGNSTVRLIGQDAMALRRHYPPEGQDAEES